MRGYKYTSENEAIKAIELVNSKYKFEGTTNKFVDYLRIEYFFVIIYNAELKQDLGEPMEIVINNNVF